MNARPGAGGPPGRAAGGTSSAAGVLADRLAAVFVHHDPGWRLPRHTTLARRYHVSPQQIEEAVRELVGRHLIRQLPDGRLYRASPADCLIPMPGVLRLAGHVDPMGSQVTCRSRKVSWRRVPEEIGWTLGLPPAQTVCAVRCRWYANEEPAAMSTTYLPVQVARRISDALGAAAHSPPVLPLGAAADGTAGDDGRAALGLPGALQLEMRPPPASVARALRLAASQTAAIVTVRFDDPGTRRPVAVTTAALRADMFRIVIESAEPACPCQPRPVAPARSPGPRLAAAARTGGNI